MKACDLKGIELGHKTVVQNSLRGHFVFCQKSHRCFILPRSLPCFFIEFSLFSGCIASPVFQLK